MAVFEKRHGELVEEAEVAVSPGEPRVSVFPAGGGCPGKKLARAPEVTGTDAAKLMAFEEQLRAIKGRALRRISEEKSGGRPGKKIAWEAIRKLEEAVGMDAAEIPAFEERVRRVHQRMRGAEQADHLGKKLAGEIGKKQQDVADMDAALQGQLGELRVSVLRQITEKEEEEKVAGAPPPKLH